MMARISNSAVSCDITRDCSGVFEEMRERVGLFFSRRDTRSHAKRYVKGHCAENWLRMSAGAGMKGPRLYDWAAGRFGAPDNGGLVRWLLLRRSIEKPEELAYYPCLASTDKGMRDLVEAAGGRWNIECCFETAKQETGLDEYEVRSWHGMAGIA